MIFGIILLIYIRKVWISVDIYNLVKLMVSYGIDVIICMDDGLNY